MSICLPFLLYVWGFFSKDHAYTSIEDSMAIGDPKVHWRNPENISGTILLSKEIKRQISYCYIYVYQYFAY